MKTKLSLVLLALLCISLEAISQETTPWVILEVLNRGVNVRAEPSVSSAKIASNPEFLMVFDEDAEWYHALILMNANGEESGEILPQPGYVSKKVCKVREPKAIDGDYIRNAIEHAQLTACVRETGKYEGLCAISYNTNYAADDRENLFLGILGGNYGFGILVDFSCDYDSDCVKSFGDDGETFNIPFSRIKNKDFTYNWNGLTDAEIDKVISCSTGNVYLLPGKVHFSFRDGNGETGESVVAYSVIQPETDESAEDAVEEETISPDYVMLNLKGKVKSYEINGFSWGILGDKVEFDEAGHVVKIDGKKANLTRNNKGQIIRYNYKEEDDIGELQDCCKEYQYNENGQLARIKHSTYCDYWESTFESDDDGNIVTWRDISEIEGTTPSKYKYSGFDERGNWTKLIDGKEETTRTLTYWE